jgi:hypothetical protein
METFLHIASVTFGAAMLTAAVMLFKSALEN